MKNDSVLSSWLSLVQARPDAVALVEAAHGRTWSRHQLDAEARAWLTSLPAGAALRGHRVTFALPNGAAWFAAFLGLLHAGAVPVPLDPAEPPAAQRELASSASATWAWIDGRFHSITSSESGPAPQPGEFLVKLTSGSTGRPRPLAFTDAQMLADGQQVCRSMAITPDDINFAVIPFGHSYGLGNLVIPLLAQGTPIVCASIALPHALALDIARWRPTVFPGVPALWRALAHSDLSSDALNGVRTAISAGTLLAPEIAGEFSKKFGLLIHGFYGSSETGGITYDRSGEATLAGRSVGTPLDGVAISPLEDGHIRVTSAAIVAPGYYQPADRASFNEHGELVLHGRSGRLVKIAGRRLDLGDFERALRALPGIAEAFAAVHPSSPDELAAVLATSLETAAARALLRQELAAWKIPRRLVLVAEFPLTARGKPDTAALQKLLER